MIIGRVSSLSKRYLIVKGIILVIWKDMKIITWNKAIISCKKCMWNIKNKHVLNLTYGLFGQNYRVISLSKLHLTVLGIFTQSLKSIGKFWHPI